LTNPVEAPLGKEARILGRSADGAVQGRLGRGLVRYKNLIDNGAGKRFFPVPPEGFRHPLERSGQDGNKQ
jgi:hypothetical protein